jgi:ketopantoate hydroxymethyltransferase
VKKYAELGESVAKAVLDYAEDVRQGRFPAPAPEKEEP